MNLLYVFIGGGVGSLLRYAFIFWSLPLAFFKIPFESKFPWATFTANVLACAIIGLVTQLYLRGALNTPMRLLLATGFCGGLSTFSTFSLETLQLLQSGNVGLAIVYIGASVIMCLLAVALPFLFLNR